MELYAWFSSAPEVVELNGVQGWNIKVYGNTSEDTTPRYIDLFLDDEEMVHLLYGKIQQCMEINGFCVTDFIREFIDGR